MSFRKLSIMFLTILVVGQPMLALAGSNLHIIPQDKAMFLGDGKVVSQFQSEMPLPQGQLVQCKGSCVVQGDGFRLDAHDGSVFSVSRAEKSWDLTLEKGSVDFSAKPGTNPSVFRTANDTTRVEKVVFPSGDGLLKGNATITEKGMQITLISGELSLMTRNGPQTVRAGQAVLIAEGQNHLAEAATATAAAGAAAGAAAAAGGSAVSAPVVGAGVVAAAGVVLGVGVLGGGNDSVTPISKDVSPY